MTPRTTTDRAALGRAKALAAATKAALLAPIRRIAGPGTDPDEHERGDVPGWVMITMMTAIVVIVLLGVFQEAVVNAIQNAFDSIQG